MPARINSSFIFIIIKCYKKNIYRNEILKFLNITSKLKIKTIIYDIELILNKNHTCILN